MECAERAAAQKLRSETTRSLWLVVTACSSRQMGRVILRCPVAIGEKKGAFLFGLLGFKGKPSQNKRNHWASEHKSQVPQAQVPNKLAFVNLQDKSEDFMRKGKVGRGS